VNGYELDLNFLLPQKIIFCDFIIWWRYIKVHLMLPNCNWNTS